MNTKWITIGVLLGCVTILVGWDIYVAINPPDGDTISEVLFQWAGDHPVVPFVIGVLCGHWFWPQYKEK